VRLHLRHRPAPKPDGSHDVRVPVVLPLGVVGFGDSLVGTGAGIVDQDVRAAQLRRRRDHLGAALGGCDVGGDAVRFDPVLRADPGRLSMQPLRAARRDQHVGPFRGEALGDGEADADAATRDNGEFAPKSQIHSHFPSP